MLLTVCHEIQEVLSEALLGASGVTSDIQNLAVSEVI